ncbi:MAG: Uma2 family endonuclease [Bryobacteraceae bacterium]|jgi:Uma2 family endonuclease
MGASTPLKTVSVDEYLSNPEYRHSEYVDGEVVALNVGTQDHGTIQVNCGFFFKQYFLAHPIGYAAAELHCRLTIAGRQRYRLPDVAVVLGERARGAQYLDRAPDLVVEIRSPEDSLNAQMRKMRDYFANGTRLAWLILPEEQTVLVLTPDSLPDSVGIGETLDGGTVLPGLSVPVADLFV